MHNCRCMNISPKLRKSASTTYVVCDLSVSSWVVTSPWCESSRSFSRSSSHYTSSVKASSSRRCSFGRRPASVWPRHTDAQGAALVADCTTRRVQTVPTRTQNNSRSCTDQSDWPAGSSLWCLWCLWCSEFASNGNFVVSRTRLKLGDRCFLSLPLAPGIDWLPMDLKLSRSTPAFKLALKTFLFQVAH